MPSSPKVEERHRELERRTWDAGHSRALAFAIHEAQVLAEVADWLRNVCAESHSSRACLSFVELAEELEFGEWRGEITE